MDSKRSGRTIRAGLLHIGVFSAIANVLILTLPLYLLQIYDRVLPAASQSTLLYISLVGLLALVVLAIIDVIRSHLAARLNQKLDVAVGDSIFLAAVNSPRAALGDVQPLRDLAVIRGFVSSRALFFLFDLPFAPFFVVLVYLIHPVLFWVTVGGAVVMVAVALLNEFASHRGSREAAEALANAFNAAQAFGRNFETVRALGMVGNATAAWGERNATALIANERVARVNSLWGGVARSLRMLLQLVTLGVGALLVLRGEMTAGMIFASSMITSRALQPLDQVVSAWRQIAESRAAYRRIRGISLSEPPVRTPLPAPTGELDVSQVVYAPPNALPNAPPLIKGIGFHLDAGESLAIIGPSQAGKSTLARLIVGAIRPRTGVVRIDGADIANADPDVLGREIGYLPQEVELFPGTIAQNISRFDPAPPEEAILAAARRSQAHELILGQRNGYDTDIGPGGVRLSGGEKQRIGLARAFYGNPRLLVLDEPNANLDAEGEAALERALADAKVDRVTVILVTHRPQTARVCDKVMFLREGKVEAFGPAEQVLNALARSPRARPQPQPQPPEPVRLPAVPHSSWG